VPKVIVEEYLSHCLYLSKNDSVLLEYRFEVVGKLERACIFVIDRPVAL
jgi:hypothetical protein